MERSQRLFLLSLTIPVQCYDCHQKDPNIYGGMMLQGQDRLPVSSWLKSKYMFHLISFYSFLTSNTRLWIKSRLYLQQRVCACVSERQREVDRWREKDRVDCSLLNTAITVKCTTDMTVDRSLIFLRRDEATKWAPWLENERIEIDENG